MVGYNSDGVARDRVLNLMTEKDRIENEIRDQTAILETSNIGMHEPLVDSDGFPRNDIDVYKIRHVRHRIICLQNDHKALMIRIEKGLAEVHADFMGANGEGPSQNMPSASNSYTNGLAHDLSDVTLNDSSKLNNEHFAYVGFVHNGSPADLAGLAVNDKVVEFGSINVSNFTDVMQVHNLVSHSVGQRIQVRVKRENNVHNLTVVPRPWTHPGLLGCQIQRRAN